MNTEKFTKEKITKDEILFDLLAVEQQLNRRGGEAYLYAIIPCTVLSVLVGILLHNIWLSLVFAAVAILHVGYMIPIAVRSRIMRKTLKAAIENEAFTLTEERLLSVEEQKEKNARIFRFESGANWQIPNLSEHYEWSELCRMSSEGLDHTSIVGDEFFTVTLDVLPEIHYLYNKKLFDYQNK